MKQCISGHFTKKCESNLITLLLVSSHVYCQSVQMWTTVLWRYNRGLNKWLSTVGFQLFTISIMWVTSYLQLIITNWLTPHSTPFFKRPLCCHRHATKSFWRWQLIVSSHRSSKRSKQLHYCCVSRTKSISQFLSLC